MLGACAATGEQDGAGGNAANMAIKTDAEGTAPDLNRAGVPHIGEASVGLPTYRLAPIPEGAVRNEVGLQGTLRIEGNCVTVEVDERITVIPIFPLGTADLADGKLNFRGKTWSDGDVFSGGGFQDGDGSASSFPFASPIPTQCPRGPTFFLTG